MYMQMYSLMNLHSWRGYANSRWPDLKLEQPPAAEQGLSDGLHSGSLCNFNTCLVVFYVLISGEEAGPRYMGVDGSALNSVQLWTKSVVMLYYCTLLMKSKSSSDVQVWPVHDQS